MLHAVIRSFSAQAFFRLMAVRSFAAGSTAGAALFGLLRLLLGEPPAAAPLEFAAACGCDLASFELSELAGAALGRLPTGFSAGFVCGFFAAVVLACAYLAGARSSRSAARQRLRRYQCLE